MLLNASYRSTLGFDQVVAFHAPFFPDTCCQLSNCSNFTIWPAQWGMGVTMSRSILVCFKLFACEFVGKGVIRMTK